MKVGILTYHHTPNYGATLQGYALSAFLCQQNHTTEFINYQPEKAIEFYRQELYMNARMKRDMARNFLRVIKMGLFVKWKMPTSKIYSKPESLQNFSHRYDAVIVGSDQIWDINSPIRGVDTSYFLDFIASTDIRKISYAASFGSTSSLGEHKEKISGLLDSFYRLSVRDSNSLKLLEQECKRQAVKVLDPTFLIQYDNLVGKNKGREDHILVYGGLPASLTQPIRDLSKKLNLPVISVGHINNQVAEISNLQAGPIQWLKYFASAKYIFTNYYHGVIFSIIFRKPFSVFLAEKKIWKIGDLLKDLGLSDRIYSDTTKLKPGFSEINYSSVFEKIEEKRSIARQYLLDSLEYGN